MAGRVINRIMSPNRPSPKGYLLILHFAVDVKRLVEEGKDNPWPVVEMSVTPGAAVLVSGVAVSGFAAEKLQGAGYLFSVVAFTPGDHSCNSSHSM